MALGIIISYSNNVESIIVIDTVANDSCIDHNYHHYSKLISRKFFSEIATGS